MPCYDPIIKNPYQTYYSATYKTTSSQVINDQWIQVMKSRCGIPFSSKNKVLDVACGISTLGKVFSDNVYGFDTNHQAISIARKNGINAKIGNVEKKWRYPDNHFDIVIASHIIEHMVDPDHLLLEAKRVLKRNGLLIVATPNLAAWFNRILLLFGVQPFFTEVSTVDKTLGMKFMATLTTQKAPMGHLRVFTTSSLIDLLKLHRFTIMRKAGAEFLALPAPLLFVDKLFSHNTSLASNIVMVGKKST